MKLRVAIAQTAVQNNNVNENFKTIAHFIRCAAKEHADILLTPEGALSGYDYAQSFRFGEINRALEELSQIAGDACLGLAVGTICEEHDLRYNQLRFYDKQGMFLGAHCKILLCGPVDGTIEPRHELTSCATQPLAVFEFMGVKVGGLLCNDMWGNPGCTPMPDPHLVQQLAQMGAKIIFHAVNGGRDESEQSQQLVRAYHESNLRLRAQAGHVWIVTVDNAAPVTLPNSSMGGVIAPDGSWRAMLPVRGEQFAVAEIDLERLPPQIQP